MHSQLARQLKAVLKSKISQMGRTVRSTSHRFYQEEQGAVAIIFALSLLPLIVLAGAAIDYSRTSSDRQQLQDAIDAAALAAVNRIPFETDDEVIKNLVRSYVAANIPGGTNVNVNLIEIERNPNKIKVWANGSTEMTFMKLAQINSMDFKAKSQAVSSDKSIEVVMVLDNSGSMRGRRLTDLKIAAKGLVKALKDNQQSEEDLMIGLVPFNHLVRLDKSYRNASWFDHSAKSSIHRNNLPKKSNRFELFDTLKNTEWEGCVEARKHPYDIKDTTANIKFNDSYFIPYFNPDNYYNNYVSDKLPKSARKNPNKDRYGKYHKRKPRNGRSPNQDCYIQPITPMTKNLSRVNIAIDEMTANGWTNIHMGTIWGVRALSNAEPLTQGKPYDDKENLKFLIIMSDGANTSNTYSAYGFRSEGRISGSSNTRREMDKRTSEACQAAKANKQIIVYTIAHGNPGGTTKEMLQGCASDPQTHYFESDNGGEMIEVFKKIAAALNNVRITE